MRYGKRIHIILIKDCNIAERVYIHGYVVELLYLYIPLFLENKNLIQHPFSGFSSYICTHKKSLQSLRFPSFVWFSLSFSFFGSALIRFLLFRLKKHHRWGWNKQQSTTRQSNYEQIKDICADDYGRWSLLVWLFAVILCTAHVSLNNLCWFFFLFLYYV